MSQRKPTAEKLKTTQKDFRQWADDRSEGDGRVAETRLADAMGVSRNAFRNARKYDWTGRKGSLYWRWLERGEVLQAMVAAELNRLSDEFRAVRDAVGMSIRAVGDSWWKNGGYGGLGVEVLRDGEAVQVRVLPQGDGGDGDKSADADTGIDTDNQGVDLGENSPVAEASADITSSDGASSEMASAKRVSPGGTTARSLTLGMIRSWKLSSQRAAEESELAKSVSRTYWKACADLDECAEPIEFLDVADGADTYGRPFDGRVRVPDELEESLLRIRPGRIGAATLQTFENVLESMGDGHVYSLEIVSEGGEIELLIRTTYPERVAQHISSHYPGSVIESVSEDEDPIRMREGETGYRHVLHPSGDEWLPFQVYDEQQVRDGGDPFIDVLGGMMGVDLRAGERLVSRIVLRQQPHNWSEDWRARAMSGTGGENQMLAEKERRRIAEEDEESRRRFSQSQRQAYQNVNESGTHGVIVGAVVIMACLMVSYFLRQLWTEDKLVQFWLYGIGAVLLFGLSAIGAWKLGLFRGKKVEEAKFYDPDQVAIRISGSAFQVEVHTMVFLGAGETNALNRARQLLNTVNGVYRGFDNPLGCRFMVEDIRQLREVYAAGADVSAMELPGEKDGWDVLCEQMLFFAVERRRYGFFSKPAVAGVIGVKEIVAFWHIPGEGVELSAL